MIVMYRTELQIFFCTCFFHALFQTFLFFFVCIVAHCHQSHDPHLHSHTSSSFRIFKVTLPMIETFICVLVLSVMAVEGQNEVKCDF